MPKIMRVRRQDSHRGPSRTGVGLLDSARSTELRLWRRSLLALRPCCYLPDRFLRIGRRFRTIKIAPVRESGARALRCRQD
jgi:hypothetical protein